MPNFPDRANCASAPRDRPANEQPDRSGVNLRRIMPAFATAVALGLMLAVTQPADAEALLRSGTFDGQSDHVTTGTVRIVGEGDRTVLIFGADFSLDGAPSPTIGFSLDGKFVDASEFSELKSLNGEQRNVLPVGLDSAEYDTVTIWCDQFSVPLGSAPLG